MKSFSDMVSNKSDLTVFDILTDPRIKEVCQKVHALVIKKDATVNEFTIKKSNPAHMKIIQDVYGEHVDEYSVMEVSAVNFEVRDDGSVYFGNFGFQFGPAAMNYGIYVSFVYVEKFCYKTSDTDTEFSVDEIFITHSDHYTEDADGKRYSRIGREFGPDSVVLKSVSGKLSDKDMYKDMVSKIDVSSSAWYQRYTEDGVEKENVKELNMTQAIKIIKDKKIEDFDVLTVDKIAFRSKFSQAMFANALIVI